MFDPGTKILVVDDMLTMRKIVTKSLKELGFTVIEDAKDGGQAWEKINSANPAFQLIVSDWNMPNTTGLDLLKRVRADSRFAKLPFILLTAESEKEQIIEAAKAGVSGYIIKPFKTDTLKAKLEEVYKKVTA